MQDDRRIERIELKIDDISEKLNDTNIILAKQHESLREHMRRTAIMEKIILPLQKRANMVDGILKLIVLLAAVAAIIEALKAANL